MKTSKKSFVANYWHAQYCLSAWGCNQYALWKFCLNNLSLQAFFFSTIVFNSTNFLCFIFSKVLERGLNVHPNQRYFLSRINLKLTILYNSLEHQVGQVYVYIAIQWRKHYQRHKSQDTIVYCSNERTYSPFYQEIRAKDREKKKCLKVVIFCF